MKRKIKPEKLSVRWKIFGYLALFVAILILLLCLFQTVFLDSFYRAIKASSIKNTANQIVQSIESSDLTDRLTSLSQQNDVCIRIVDQNFIDLYNAEIMPNCLIHHMPRDLLEQYHIQAKSQSGTALELFSIDKLFKNNHLPSERGPGRANMLPPFRRDNQSMIYIKIVTASDGSTRTILLNAMLSPLNATVDTLRIQLVYISIIFFILAILLSFLISRKISKPIEHINESAKELAYGNYSTDFSGFGYREISELNDTLNYAASELSKADLLRRELIANVSHDLRTPLTMITGYGEMMRDIPGENTAENVQIIIDESRHLSDLVSDLLDLSKLQANTDELNSCVFNLTDDIRNTINRYTKFTELEGYSLRFICDRDVFVCADDLRISQVIYNLISNAIHYTGDDKSVTVRQSINNNAVKIEVIDTGKGIEADKLPYVWERYYHTDKSHKRAVVGTGLGLSIVKAILELHRAKYGVVSAVEKGSTFWFELPIVNNNK